MRCSSLLGVRGVVIPDGAPEPAFDLDEPGDLRYAVHALEAAP